MAHLIALFASCPTTAGRVSNAPSNIPIQEKDVNVKGTDDVVNIKTDIIRSSILFYTIAERG